MDLMFFLFARCFLNFLRYANTFKHIYYYISLIYIIIRGTCIQPQKGTQAVYLYRDYIRYNQLVL